MTQAMKGGPTPVAAGYGAAPTALVGVKDALSAQAVVIPALNAHQPVGRRVLATGRAADGGCREQASTGGER